MITKEFDYFFEILPYRLKYSEGFLLTHLSPIRRLHKYLQIIGQIFEEHVKMLKNEGIFVNV